MYTLITGATTSQSYQLKNKLSTENIIMGDYHDLPAFMLSSANIIKLPNPQSASYAHEMLTLCLDKEIDTVYALGEDELENLIKAEQLFNEYGIEIARG